MNIKKSRNARLPLTHLKMSANILYNVRVPENDSFAKTRVNTATRRRNEKNRTMNKRWAKMENSHTSNFLSEFVQRLGIRPLEANIEK